ncbi:MAG: polysaccharide lyase [Rhizobiaceae bacterium]|nr:polysaccharide lyase [Rhizobiaceae bacterium]
MKKVVALAMFLTSVFSTSEAMADEAYRAPLFDGFEGRTFSAEGGLYYKDNAEQRAGIVEFDPTAGRDGRGALKLTVRPGCGVGADGCSERAEIWERPKLRVPYDMPVWYGFAVKFADPVPTDDHRYLIAQWKREIDPGAPGDFSPFLALRLRKGRLFATVEANHFAPVRREPKDTPARCGPGETAVWLRPETNQMRALVATDGDWQPEDGALFNACTDRIEVIDRGNPLPTPGSGWIDFAIMTKPGPDGTGHIEIFANDKWIVTVKGYIGHNDPPLGDNQYFKFGPYRAAAQGEWTLYYDDFRRSLDRADVLGRKAACHLDVPPSC